MKQLQLLLIACTALLTSACSDRYSTSQYDLNTGDTEYGSTDTYKDNIEIAGRVYDIKAKPEYVSAPQLAYNSYVQPYYSNNITTTPPAPATTRTASANSYDWYMY